MMSEQLRPIDANGYVPGPYGQLPPDAAERFEELARCHECGLLTIHGWNCRTGQLIKDVAVLLEAAEVFDRRGPAGPAQGAWLRTRAEQLSREIA